MASRQDPTAADIAYAQYSAAEKTRMVGGRVYHRIICKTPLPAPVGGVELVDIASVMSQNLFNCIGVPGAGRANHREW